HMVTPQKKFPDPPTTGPPGPAASPVPTSSPVIAKTDSDRTSRVHFVGAPAKREWRRRTPLRPRNITSSSRPLCPLSDGFPKHPPVVLEEYRHVPSMPFRPQVARLQMPQVRKDKGRRRCRPRLGRLPMLPVRENKRLRPQVARLQVPQVPTDQGRRTR